MEFVDVDLVLYKIHRLEAEKLLNLTLEQFLDYANENEALRCNEDHIILVHGKLFKEVYSIYKMDGQIYKKVIDGTAPILTRLFVQKINDVCDDAKNMCLANAKEFLKRLITVYAGITREFYTELKNLDKKERASVLDTITRKRIQDWGSFLKNIDHILNKNLRISRTYELDIGKLIQLYSQMSEDDQIILYASENAIY